MANIYLDPLDHHMVEQGFNMARYADDFLILCRTPAKAAEAHELVRVWLEGVGLTLNLEKTRLVDLGDRDGFNHKSIVSHEGYPFHSGEAFVVFFCQSLVVSVITLNDWGNHLSPNGYQLWL